MWDKVVTLKGGAAGYTGGFPDNAEPIEKEVYAEEHSVKSSIFYAAQAAGVQLDAAFTVRMADYDRQMELVHGGIPYEVVNTYKLDSERIDLNCRRR